jgi:hypothetical protein
MSNIITPINNIDFSAAIAEITPFLENQVMAIPKRTPHSDMYLILAPPQDFPVTNAILGTMNLSMVNPIYAETEGGAESYQHAQSNSCIVLPLEVTGSTVGAYSVPLGSSKMPDLAYSFYKEDCTLIEEHQPADGPLFINTNVDGFELATYFNIPSGKTLKSIIIFVNEETL